MKKKTKRKPPSKPIIRKAESGPKGKRNIHSTAKEKEQLIRIWDEDLCE